MPTNFGNFDQSRALFNNAIFVIPTFQRPYAWESEQFKDLIEDIRFAADRIPPNHYLSPIHVIKIDNPNQDEWSNYTDNNNPHINLLSSSGFTDDEGAINVYLVVDGQQRLTTLFMLFNSVLKLTRLMITIRGNKIPRVILNPKPQRRSFSIL